MSLQEVVLRDRYVSGNYNLIDEFYIPCLSRSISYDRAAGFFNSTLYYRIKMGLEPFIKNGGKIRLITSIHITPGDAEKIRSGYEERQWLSERLSQLYEEFYLRRHDFDVANLCWLIQYGRLDVRITVPADISDESYPMGIFHDKIGVFSDDESNYIVFFGSNNESLGGWINNYESFEVYSSWDQSVSKRAETRKEDFERLWNGTMPGVHTHEFPEAFHKSLISLAPTSFHFEHNADNRINENKPSYFAPRQCQKDAVQMFTDSRGICLYQMATGTGKTKAALYTFQLIKDDWKLLLILVPSLDLVLQWQRDVKVFFPNEYIVLCGSNAKGWKTEFIDLIQARIPFKTILISTYQSASTAFVLDNLSRLGNEQIAIIGDEVHNLGAAGNQKIMEKLAPQYRLGLSATPARNFDEEGTELILDYFNHNSFEVSIADAIREQYLVEYEYYITPVFLTDGEWAEYIELSNQISRLHFSGQKEEDSNRSYLERLLERRAKILKTAEGKQLVFPELIDIINSNQRTLIYGDSIDHLQAFGNILMEMSKEYFTYVGEVNASLIRPRMIEDFSLGIRKYLLAVKCLDEGVDIPACDSAIFISSSTSTREFVQRRGRVLRKGPNKRRAYLYDFIVIPPYNAADPKEYALAKKVIEKEYQRITLMAEDAINGTETKTKLDNYLRQQDLDPYSF